MPFRPLPKTFVDHLNLLDPRQDIVLELGSGEGQFGALLAPFAVPVVGLDRSRFGLEDGDVVGDARRVPVRSGSVAIVVAPNLVRHLAPRRELGQWVASWRALLKPGGRLYVFEDAPTGDAPAHRNFRDLQAFLARLLPESRGALLPRSRFRELVAEALPGAEWSWGEQANDSRIDAGEVMRMLGAGQGAADGPVAGMIRRIGRDGVAPGRYWWGSVAAEEA